MIKNLRKLRRTYRLVIEYDDGTETTERIKFPTLDWWICSIVLVLMGSAS